MPAVGKDSARLRVRLEYEEHLLQHLQQLVRSSHQGHGPPLLAVVGDFNIVATALDITPNVKWGEPFFPGGTSEGKEAVRLQLREAHQRLLDDAGLVVGTGVGTVPTLVRWVEWNP